MNDSQLGLRVIDSEELVSALSLFVRFSHQELQCVHFASRVTSAFKLILWKRGRGSAKRVTNAMLASVWPKLLSIK